ncbi:MAG: Transcriptional antiterminator, BglG [Caldanaerobacter subterraneus]|jgi:transcriptional antiterminator|uniref:Transcriptional antiterminator, BglG n=2 Tax=Thermoanaerobacter TaxID=1754 RepID=B0KCA3_THEP3|nr:MULTISPECIES: PRD domain-containing protein [Thermoanaerobacter]KUJ90976.1 MAG: CAT RNA-binding domain-containing protein [Thermoanaerobacter thermocopriae]KUK34676.1 MAG: Transcriptional antiterminator, BglG [Caldanaerobacter subterraneus]ABY91724.1 transcriptional antiterminator, BglG [Thermoanaerobacter sp. X514]ABY95457.1 transcriptional antiterminator, BglG [Thermoanaerobacter pseudethanolicus ATCC 33223]ADV80401.1 CAT RNA-binding domain protein [Thermoanaerobacter brockii subsp. finni
MYQVVKVLNNNVCMAKDDKGMECIVVGKGIGFGKRPGDIIEEDKLEKIFYVQEDVNKIKFSELMEKIRGDVIGIAEEIIAMAEKIKGKKLNEHIHIALADHIAFAIERINMGIEIKNPFDIEIKALYKDDYNIALKALELINQRLNISLPEDEAGFIALHLHAALENAGLSNTVKNTRLVSQLVSTIEKHLGKYIDRDSIDYIRLVTHLRFAIDRVEKNAPVTNELLVSIKKKFKKAYNIAMQVSKIIEDTLQKKVPEEETGYIAIHIQRLINTI